MSISNEDLSRLLSPKERETLKAAEQEYDPAHDNAAALSSIGREGGILNAAKAYRDAYERHADACSKRDEIARQLSTARTEADNLADEVSAARERLVSSASDIASY